jgi:2-polyprenyl-3-methyl-5-hydroxy-6-metoxy-1,4-benzoquinol methylase
LSSGYDVIVRDLEIASVAVNYRKWILSNIKKAIGQRVIELGAGIGNFTEFFLDKELVVAVDIHEPALEYLRRRFSGRNNVVVRGIDIGTPGIMELAEYRADTIVCLNVLEHLPMMMSY